MGLAGGLAANGGIPTTLASLPDVVIGTPNDGDVLTFVSSSGKSTMVPLAGAVATGPGSPGVPFANAGATPAIPDPTGSKGFGLYAMTLNAACTPTFATPSGAFAAFVLAARQDVTGGRTLTLADVTFPDVQLNLDLTPNAENLISFLWYADNTGTKKWWGFPLTSAAQNLSDVPDPPAARFNLGVVGLSAPRTVYTANVTSGTVTGGGLPGASADGTVPIASDVVLLTAQSTGSQNGLWQVKSTVPWVRLHDFNTGKIVRAGRTATVYGGTTYKGTTWVLTNQVTVDTDTPTFVQPAPPAVTSPAQIATFNTSNAAWAIPAGATKLGVRAVGGGGGGGGGGTVVAGAVQSGGAGGGAGSSVLRRFTVSSSTHLNVTVGGGGNGGPGGAAGAHAGTDGTGGTSTTVVGDGADGITITAPGGAGGSSSSATSTGNFQGGARGGAPAGTGGGVTSGAQSPGNGGSCRQSSGVSSAGGAPVDLSGGGGAGGASSSTTNGGVGGNAGTLAAGGAASNSVTGSTSGANGSDAAANTAAGGGGGGAGTNNTGAGGTGGAGGSGYVEVEVHFS